MNEYGFDQRWGNDGGEFFAVPAFVAVSSSLFARSAALSDADMTQQRRGLFAAGTKGRFAGPSLAGNARYRHQNNETTARSPAAAGERTTTKVGGNLVAAGRPLARRGVGFSLSALRIYTRRSNDACIGIIGSLREAKETAPLC
ncbi:hypothetical protein LJR030_004324 [Rhizobium sp. LjRoot30]|uniref:hypothetical protein n=1 Tax=Rhizobium sp. LjRoot30 TaxID=3342320 RepID=UPI003ECD2161